MSGGEKSLTSLAFVFSLQRFMPAPFYALDEVDMNLDGINAEKLANMVKREAKLAPDLWWFRCVSPCWSIQTIDWGHSKQDGIAK